MTTPRMAMQTTLIRRDIVGSKPHRGHAPSESLVGYLHFGHGAIAILAA
jgi:hypothetical protein